MAATNGVVRIAAMSDVHCGKESGGTLQAVFAQVATQADVLVLCGDLTDYGLPDEARLLTRELGAALRIPIIAVLGNHDFEAGKEKEICDVLSESGVRVLDGDSHEVHLVFTRPLPETSAVAAE